MKKIFIICTILWALISTAASQKRVVCYWNSFSRGNEGLKGFFEVKDIDPTICTHIIYTYLRFTTNVNFISDYDDAVVREFINLKNKNSNVKLLIGIGGPRQGTIIPSKIASTATDREEFSQKVKKFINDFNFDGCDFDWQWPSQGSGSSTNDRNNYVRLLQNLRQVLTSSKIISISAAPRQEDIEKSYDIPNIINYVDFINLNVYNLHGLEGETVTAFHSAYRKDPNAMTIESEWNAESIVDNWFSNGCPAEKLTLGIPTYGKSFTLSDIQQTGVGAPVSGLGSKSEYLADISNIIPYAEICHNLLTNAKWVDSWNTAHFAPYAVFSADQWVGFDDLRVVRAKIHLALGKNLGGLNYATVDRDDFNGQCGGTKFPLIKIGYDAIVNGIIPTNPIETTTTTTPSTTTSTTTPSTTTSTTTPSTTTSTTTPSTTTSTTTSTSTTSTTIPTSTLSTTTPQITITFPQITTTSRKDPDEDTRPPIATQSTTTTKRTTSLRTTSTRTTTKKTTRSEFPTPPVTPKSVTSTQISNSQTDEDEIQESGESETVISSSSEVKVTTENIPTPPVTPGQRSKRSADEKFVCPESNGKFKNPNNCGSYILCIDYAPYAFYCNSEHYYNEYSEYCDQQSKVLC